MKWIKENKCKSFGILFATITAFFVMLDSAFDFWEEHIVRITGEYVAESSIVTEKREIKRTVITQKLISKDSLTTARGY